MSLVTDAKQLAKNAVSWITGQVGQDLVAAVWAVMTGGSTANVIHEASEFVEEILSAARALLTDEELAAEILAANAAVDAAVDALEKARLDAMAAAGAKD